MNRNDLLVGLLGDGTVQRPEVLSQRFDGRRTHNGRRDELARVDPSQGHLRRGETDLSRTTRRGHSKARTQGGRHNTSEHIATATAVACFRDSSKRDEIITQETRVCCAATVAKKRHLVLHGRVAR